MSEVETKDAEIIEEESERLPARVEAPAPGAVVSRLDSLAEKRGVAIEEIEAKIDILERLRKAAIKITSPEDWLLFRTREGQESAYLQDCGAERVRDLYGVSIFNVREPQKEVSGDGREFCYRVIGDGHCQVTGKTVEGFEGVRYSTDDFLSGKSGLQLENAVRKAARANLDGGLVRELTGLNSVPVDELRHAWDGTYKSVEKCHKGRGYGSAAERAGADPYETEGLKKSDLPPCPKCAGAMRLVPAGQTAQGKKYDAFLACEKGKKKCGGTMSMDQFEELKARAEAGE